MPCNITPSVITEGVRCYVCIYIYIYISHNKAVRGSKAKQESDDATCSILTDNISENGKHITRELSHRGLTLGFLSKA